MANTMADKISLYKLITGDLESQFFTKTEQSVDTIIQQVENVITKHTLSADVYLGLQQYSNINGSRQRYEQLAQAANQVFIFGSADAEAPALPDVEYVTIPNSDPLASERFLVVNTPFFYTALITREVDSDPNSGQRRFEGVWTYDEQVVTQAYLLLSLYLGKEYSAITHRDYQQHNKYVAEISNNLANQAEAGNGAATPKQKSLVKGFNDLKAQLSAHPEVSNAVLDSLSAHVTVIDKDGNIVDVNEAWQEFAWDNSEIAPVNTGIGTNYLDICKTATGAWSEEAMPAYEGLKKVLDGELEEFDLEYPCHSPNEQRFFLMRAVPLDSEEGGAVISHINITKLKQSMENSLRDAQAAWNGTSTAANMDAGELIARIQSVNKLASMLPSLGALSPTQAEAVNRINQLNAELNSMLEQIGGDDSAEAIATAEGEATADRGEILKRIQASPPPQQLINITPVVTQVVDTFRSRANNKGIALETDIAANLNPIKGDATHLQVALAELLDNALKYNEGGAQVRVLAGVHKDNILIAVRDNGEGIPMREVADLFKAGYRGSTSGDTPGEGLGLAIAGAVAEKHGGTAMVDSRMGRGGSVFVIKIPLP